MQQVTITTLKTSPISLVPFRTMTVHGQTVTTLTLVRMIPLIKQLKRLKEQTMMLTKQQ